MSDFQALLAERDALPGLPDLDALKHQAYQVLDLNRRIVEEAQAEVDKARTILAQHGASQLLRRRVSPSLGCHGRPRRIGPARDRAGGTDQ